MTASVLGALVAVAFTVACGGSGDAKIGAIEAPASTPCSPLGEHGAAIEYEAVTSDGHYVVTLTDGATRAVTRRVFYGIPARMVEGTITDIENSCARYVSFDLGVTPYTATLAGKICRSSVPGRLDIGPEGPAHTVLPLTIVLGDGQPAAVAPETFSYLCL